MYIYVDLKYYLELIKKKNQGCPRQMNFCNLWMKTRDWLVTINICLPCFFKIATYVSKNLHQNLLIFSIIFWIPSFFS